MSVRAYAMIEKDFEGHTWRRMSSDETFSLYDLTRQEERFLIGIGFYHWLSEDCSGYTETCMEDIDNELKEMRPEERFRIKDLVYLIKEDIKENDGYYIQYNVG